MSQSYSVATFVYPGMVQNFAPLHTSEHLPRVEGVGGVFLKGRLQIMSMAKIRSTSFTSANRIYKSQKILKFSRQSKPDFN